MPDQVALAFVDVAAQRDAEPLFPVVVLLGLADCRVENQALKVALQDDVDDTCDCIRLYAVSCGTRQPYLTVPAALNG